MPDPRRGRSVRPTRGAGPIAGGLLLLALFAAAAVPPLPAAGPSAEFDRAASTILCDCGCHPQSVAECTCGRAAEMRADIQAMVDRGMSGDAVIADYVARYGDKIRIAPTARGFNLLAWLGPLVVLLLGLVGVAWLARRLSRAAGRSESVSAPGPPADEVYLARVRQKVEERR